MKIRQQGNKLNVSDIDQLAAANSRRFQATLEALLPSSFKEIELDLSNTSVLDCGGVGALVALRNQARQHNSRATVRLLNPARRVSRMLKLTGMDRVFDVQRRPSAQ